MGEEECEFQQLSVDNSTEIVYTTQIEREQTDTTQLY